MAGTTKAHRLPLWALAALSLAAALLCATPAKSGKVSSSAKRPPAKSLQALKALERLEPTALRRWPETFGGLWLERGKVFIAFTTGGKQAVKRLASRINTHEPLRAVLVDDSLAALRQIQARMIADREVNPVMDTDPASGRPIRLSYDLDVDIKRNMVVAIVEKPVTPALAGSFRGRYGEDVVVEQGLLTKPLACTSQFFCTPDLRAGLLIGGSAANWFCTSAFTAFAGPTQYILSAAHCGNDPVPNQGAPPDPGGDRIHGGSTYGTVTFEQFSGKLDAEAHTIQNLNLYNALKPWIYVNDAQRKGVVGSVGTYDGLPVGLKICKVGAKTFRTCGDVLSKSYSPDYLPNGMDFVKADMCSEPGDSGGAVYRSYTKYPPKSIAQNVQSSGPIYRAKQGPIVNQPFPTRYRALGVVSAGIETMCGSAGDYTIFGHIEFIVGTFPITIRTGP